MKKLLTSKTITIGAFVIVCITIIIVCLITGNSKKNSFEPDPIQTENQNETWEENESNFIDDINTDIQNETKDEYPKITKEDEQEIVIDFNDPAPIKDPAPSDPGTKQDEIEHSAVPTQSPSNDGVPQEKSADNNPAPGSTNEKGQIYDPVFGWITPANVVEKNIDSDGDPNKMVGEMD